MSNGCCDASPPALKKKANASSTSSTRISVFGSDVEVRYQLRVGVRKGKANRFIGSPQDAMSQTIAIERYRRIKISDAKHMIVELSKQGPAQAHREPILPLAACVVGPTSSLRRGSALPRPPGRSPPRRDRDRYRQARGRSPLRLAICPGGPFRARRACRAECGRHSRREES
jgi:hypothetical protein